MNNGQQTVALIEVQVERQRLWHPRQSLAAGHWYCPHTMPAVVPRAGGQAAQGGSANCRGRPATSTPKDKLSMWGITQQASDKVLWLWVTRTFLPVLSCCASSTQWKEDSAASSAEAALTLGPKDFAGELGCSSNMKFSSTAVGGVTPLRVRAKPVRGLDKMRRLSSLSSKRLGSSFSEP